MTGKTPYVRDALNTFEHVYGLMQSVDAVLRASVDEVACGSQDKQALLMLHGTEELMASVLTQMRAAVDQGYAEWRAA